MFEKYMQLYGKYTLRYVIVYHIFQLLLRDQILEIYKYQYNPQFNKKKTTTEEYLKKKSLRQSTGTLLMLTL